MVHVIFGNGKGKTTSSIGSAVRASGSGMQVLFVQFMKQDDTSEIQALSSFSGIECVFPKDRYQLFEELNDTRMEELQKAHTQVLERLQQEYLCKCFVSNSNQRKLMVVLDEAVSACSMGLLSEERLRQFIEENRDKAEIILTGHEPKEWMLEMADYVSEIVARKHPYEKGVKARRGIEY